MSDEEASRFAANKVARLVGLLPFLAGCEEAERTALAHLATYVIAGRGGARASFDHKPADDRDPLARLETISHFQSGDSRILEAGLRRLALCMVAGYRRDAEKDRAAGAYNPLAAGAWEGEAMVAKLGRSAPRPQGAVAGADQSDATEAALAAIDELLSPEAALVMVWEN